MKEFSFDPIVKERLHEYVAFLKDFDERSNKIV